MEIPDSWNLDNELVPQRVRMNGENTKKVNASTRPAQFRQPEFQARRIDEILAGRYDPAVVTKTDVFIDAVNLWLDEWDKKGMPDGANGTLRTQWGIYKMRVERVIRDNFLEEAKVQLHGLKQEGDVRRLGELKGYIDIALSDFRNEPRSYLQELESVLEQVDRLLDEAKDRY